MKASNTPNSVAVDAWLAWQAKLDASHLSQAEKLRATAVLIKLMKLRETRRSTAR